MIRRYTAAKSQTGGGQNIRIDDDSVRQIQIYCNIYNHVGVEWSVHAACQNGSVPGSRYGGARYFL